MDNYFSKIKEKEFEEHIAPVLLAEDTAAIAEKFLALECSKNKKLFKNLETPQKECILNLCKKQDFVAIKPRVFGATTLLACYLAGRLMANSSKENYNSLVILPNGCMADELWKKLRCIMELYSVIYHVCYSHHMIVKGRSVKILSSKSDSLYTNLCSVLYDEIIFDEAVFIEKDIIDAVCLSTKDTRKVFITTPSEKGNDFSKYVSENHIYQNIRWYELERYQEFGLFFYKTEKMEKPTKEQIEAKLKDGWQVCSKRYDEMKKLLGDKAITELNDYTYGRKEKN